MYLRLTVVLALGHVSAFVTPSRCRAPQTRVAESFGFDFAESQAENTDFEILGERRLKEQFIRSYKPTATVLEGKPYPLFQEVQAKKLLSATVDAGVLGALGELGLGLADVEKLLPLVDESGILALVARNLPLAIIATGYLLVEPAPFLLPVLGTLLKVPPAVWTALAAAATAGEVYLVGFTDDSGLTAVLLLPVLLLAGALSLVPTAVAAVKALPQVA